jgi:hypothetical protein
MSEEIERTPELINLDFGASARADVGASIRVKKETIRLEADRFDICINYVDRKPPPPFLRLFLSERTRIIHHASDGTWEIFDPYDPRSFPRRPIPE